MRQYSTDCTSAGEVSTQFPRAPKRNTHHQRCFNGPSALSTASAPRILLPVVVARVVVAQIVSKGRDARLTALGGGYVDAQVSEIAHEGADPLRGVRAPFRLLVVQPPLRLGVQLVLVPHLAPAALPPGAAFVAELGAAAARHVVAAEAELDDRPAARAPLPAVRLEQVVDHRAVVLAVAGAVPWVGGLLAVCAEETMASWTGHLAIECLH